MSLYPATPHVQIAFPADPDERVFVLGVSKLGGGDQLGAATSGYVDVTTHLDGDVEAPIHIRRGRSSPLSDYDTSTCELTFRNEDGRFDPLNLDGPYVAAGATLVRCGRRVLVTMEREDGTVEARFGGQIEKYQPDVSVRGLPTMKITCAGPFALLGRFDPLESSPQGTGEDSGARINRILDNADVPDGDRDVATGDSTLQATTLAQNALTECRLVAASESPIGGFYETRSGRMKFDNRTAILTDERSQQVQVTFAPPGVTDSLPYTDLEPAFDKDRLRNDIAAARTGSTQQTAEDSDSIARHMRYTDRRTDLLLETDAEVAAWVAWRLLAFGDAEYRYDSVTVDVLACESDDTEDMVEAMIVREIRDRIAVVDQVRYFDPDTDEPFTRENTVECFIEGIEEWIGWKSWRQTYDLSGAGWLSDPFILGVSKLGGTDRLMPLGVAA